MTLISERSTVGHADDRRAGDRGRLRHRPACCPRSSSATGRSSRCGQRPVVALGSLDERRVIDSSPPGQRPRPRRSPVVDPGRRRVVRRRRRSTAPTPLADRAGGRAEPGDRPARRPQRPAGLGGQRGSGSAAASCPSWTGSATPAPTVRSSTTAASTTVSPPWSSSVTRSCVGAPGATLSAAYHRALYGDHGTAGHAVELEDLRCLLAAQQPRRRRRRPRHPAHQQRRRGAPVGAAHGPVSRAGTVVGRRPGQLNPVAAVVTDRSNRPSQV